MADSTADRTEMSDEDASSPANKSMFAAVVDEVIRSADVQSDVQDFSALMVPPKICERLRRHQYIRPTPVQAKAIPLLIFGADMLVQAKAGTGKTLVFSILAAKILHETPKANSAQVLIVAPTREIAKQNHDTVVQLLPPGFTAGLFVGGIDFKNDVKAARAGVHVAVGTCGRLSQLVQQKHLKLGNVQLFVLDEADLLMDETFVKDVNFLFSSLPQEMKQVCVFSATYPQHLEETLQQYMRAPTLLRLSVEGEQLVALMEYAVVCTRTGKREVLLELLNKLVFSQCVVFGGSIEKTDELFDYLHEQQVECERLSSQMDQTERFDVLQRFKSQRSRVLVTTDLVARGIDFPAADLVINVSIAADADTHMHREGRGGRYGSQSLTITLVQNAKEAGRLRQFVAEKQLVIKLLDVEGGEFPFNLIGNREFFERCPLFTESNHFQSARSNNLKSLRSLQQDASDHSDDEETEEAARSPSPTAFEQPPVPERFRGRRLVYLRREMLALRDEWTAEEWREYAAAHMDIADEWCTNEQLCAAEAAEEDERQKTKKPADDRAHKTAKFNKRQPSVEQKLQQLELEPKAAPNDEQPQLAIPQVDAAEREQKRRAERDERRAVLAERQQKKPPVRDVHLAAAPGGRPAVHERSGRDYQTAVFASATPEGGADGSPRIGVDELRGVSRESRRPERDVGQRTVSFVDWLIGWSLRGPERPRVGARFSERIPAAAHRKRAELLDELRQALIGVPAASSS
ncbi:hypothetical protein M3Y99_01154200 [Aphelenchoides fujianensis]|nr:hypothetical protein M3Y99_01154200 [Aphelenchoides fujianensis]